MGVANVNATRSFSRRTVLSSGADAVAVGVLVGVPTTAHANRPAAMRARGYAQGPHGLVHYQDTGPAPVPAGQKAQLPLLLLHQAPMTSRQFDSVYGLLAMRGIRAIGIDTPGFGMSDPTSFVPRVDDWASSVVAVLDHLRIRKANVLGHHTGALLATEVALQFPRRVNRLILNGPFPITAAERQELLAELQKKEIDFEYRTDGQHLADSFMTRWKMYGPGADPKLTTRVIIEKFQGFGPFWYGHNAAYRYDHAAKLLLIRHPTLILLNTGDQIYEKAQRARTIRPDFAYVELEGGGVDIVDQKPVEWADAVVKYLRSIV
jgi:pimeloyl-ACP methyl ester carboxylesterase